MPTIQPIRSVAIAALLSCAMPAQSRPTSRPTPATALQSFTQEIPGTDVRFDMVAIPGGEFLMGSPAIEAGRGDLEGPQRRVRLEPFWIGRCEVTWDAYEQWMMDLERQRRPKDAEPSDQDLAADAVTRPTPPYTDMTFGMGKHGYPAICMTQKAAKTFCTWLGAKTGRTYRLPTEAEWEYACRAGTTTRYSFGDDEELLGEHAWFGRNSDDQYKKVGTKRPNPWGLHDMHGNVAEWCLDRLGRYETGDEEGAVLLAPLAAPKTLYPRVVRGGSWEDPPAACRSAARIGSDPDWKMQDPQIPQSEWYHTDAMFVGFRLVCVPEESEGR